MQKSVEFTSSLRTSDTAESSVIAANFGYDGERLRVEFELDWGGFTSFDLQRLSVFVLAPEPGQETCIFDHERRNTPESLPGWSSFMGENLERILVFIRTAAAAWESLPLEQQAPAHTCQQIFDGGFWTVREVAEWQVQFAWRFPPINIRRVMGYAHGTFHRYCETVLRAK